MFYQGSISNLEVDQNCVNQPTARSAAPAEVKEAKSSSATATTSSSNNNRKSQQQQQRPKKPKAAANMNKNGSTASASSSSSSLSSSLCSSSSTSSSSSVALIPMNRGVSEPGGLCLLCCNPIVYYTIADCAHAAEICATCTLRMKVFPPKKIDKATGKQEKFVWTCPFCKTFWNRVQLSASLAAPLSNIYDQEVDLYFDSEATVSLFKQIRAYYCTACPPEKRQERFWFANIRNLENHMDRVHGLYFCPACLETQAVFIQDRRTYTKAQLTDHYKYGTAARGDQAPIAPHPFCNFCNLPYYSDDELYVHLTTQHKQCKFCPPSQKFFRDVRKMYEHYASAHYVCQHPECNQNYEDVAAFRDLLDMKAHELTVHTDRKNMSRAELRALTTLSLGFNASVAAHPNPRGRHNHNNNNNNHNNNNHGHGGGGGRAEEANHQEEEPIVIPEDFEESYPSLGSSIADRAQAANSNLHLMSNRERKETQHLIETLSSPPLPTSSGTAATATATAAAPSVRAPVPAVQWRPPPPADEFPSLPGAKLKKDDKKGGNAAKKLASATVKTAKTSTPMRSAPMIPRPEPRGETSFPSLPIVLREKKKPAEASSRMEPFASRGVIEPTPSITITQAATAPSKTEKKAKKQIEKAASPVETKEPVAPRKPLPVPNPCPAPCSDSEVHGENQALLAQVKLLVNGDSAKLKAFRDSAASFQGGRVSAKEYYQTLLGILVGTDATKQITLLLLRLLPDDKKRKELYAEYVRHFYDSVVSGLFGGPQEKPVSVHTAHTNDANDTRQKDETDEWGSPPPYSASSSAFPSSSSSSSFSSNIASAERTTSTDSIGAPLKKFSPVLDDSFGPPLPSSKKTPSQSASTSATNSKRLDDFGPPLSSLKKSSSPLDDSFGPPLSSLKKSSQKPAEKSTNTEEVKKSAPRIDDSFGPPLTSLRRSSSLPTPELADEYLSNLAELSVPANVKKDLEFLGMVLLQVSSELGDRMGDLVNSTRARSYQCSGEKKEQLKQVVNRVRLPHVANFSPVGKFGLGAATQSALTRATSMHQSGDVEGLPMAVTQTLTQMTPQELYLLYEYLHLLLARFTDPTRSQDVQDTNKQFEESQKQQARNTQFEDLVPLKPVEINDDIFETKGKAGGDLPNRGKDKKKKDKKFVPLYLD